MRTGRRGKPMSLQVLEASPEGPSCRQAARCDLAAMMGDVLPSLKTACHAPDGPLLQWLDATMFLMCFMATKELPTVFTYILPPLHREAVPPNEARTWSWDPARL